MILSVKELAFRYPGRPVLDDINFTIDEGDCLAILGVNGAGKSTLLKCINRILKPRTGVVYIQNEAAHKLSRRELARKVAYVAQRQEDAGLTVFDSILLGRKPYIQWDASQEDMIIVRNVIEKLELQEYALRSLDELSGGELQKVIIARALAQEPDLLLLDEPTSSLDLKNQIEVIKIIRNTAKCYNMAAIVTMHDLNLAIRFADKFILLKEGAVFAAGGIEIITAENIESVYAVPVAVRKFDAIHVVIPT